MISASWGDHLVFGEGVGRLATPDDLARRMDAWRDELGATSMHWRENGSYEHLGRLRVGRGHQTRIEAANRVDWDELAVASRTARAGVRVAGDVAPVAWRAMRPPAGAGLYILRGAKGNALYVGETDALAERLGTHGGARSYFSALRRHVGTELLSLSFAPYVRRGFAPADEAAITAFLAICTVAILPLAFGRWELERELVHELRPMLNREHA